MSTNISKQKRDDLIAKIKKIKEYISSAPQDENTGNLLMYLSELEKDVNGKKYGLVFEEHREEIDKVLDTHAPVLTEDESLFIDNGGQMNFLIEGDNLAALKLLEKTHKGAIDLIYIDPPYNTGAKNWKYDNDYVDKSDLFKHSKWLSLMENRLSIAKNLLSSSGVLICAIDENEQAPLMLLLDAIFGEAYDLDCITIVHNPRGVQGNNFSYTHEYAIFVHKAGIVSIGKRKIPDSEIDWRNLRDNGGESLRTDARNCFYPIIVRNDVVIGFGEVVYDEDFHPKQCETVNGDLYVYPIDRNGIERKWRYARQSVEGIISLLRVKKQKNSYEIELGKNFGTIRTVWQDARYDANEYGKKIVNSLVPDNSFDYPKSLWNVYDCLYSVVGSKLNSVVLDFFAGSGTTGHALMQMNSEDKGNRRFILCTNNENNICREVTYERIKRVIDKEGYAASLKYYKVGFVPISDRMYYEYADELLTHVRELVELENGISFIGNKDIAIAVTDEEFESIVSEIEGGAAYKNCYLGHDILMDAVQAQILKDKGVTVHIIPDYYYKELEG